MKLRAKLAVTTVAVAVPVVAGMSWLDASARYQAAKDDLAAVTLRYMLDAGERERCESSPASWGGRPMPPPSPETRGGSPRGRSEHPSAPPPQVPNQRPGGASPILYAYDQELESRNPAAPRITGEPGDHIWPGTVVRRLVAMPWKTGPCALVLARGSTNPGWRGGMLPKNPLWVVPVGFVLLALLITAGPVVHRIRRLTRAVHESAAADFTIAVPVAGSDEVAELARAFAAVGAEMQSQLADKDRRDRTLREFVANTTHDVMIPLTVLQSHLTEIQEQRASGREVDLAAIASAMNEAHYLGALIQNLAVAASLDVGEPEIVRAPVDLGALVSRVMSRHRPIARQLEVALDGAVPEGALDVAGDVTLIEQAVNNLVYNGIRYNRPGGHVGIALDRIGAGRFQLRIVDDGPGIPAEHLSRLVERGFRGDAARTRAPGGQGLGLDIAFRVAQVHGMSLAFARSEHGGLQVDLTGPTVAGRAASL